MKPLRSIKVSFFIGVFLFLGIILESETVLAQTTWGTNAVPNRGKDGQRFTYACPAGGGPRNVWGTDVYTDDSSICIAAVHAGLITFAAGGSVTIEIRPGQSSYTGSARNGVTSGSWGGWSGSFIFVASAPPEGNRPPNAPTLLSPPNTWSPPLNPSSITFQWQNNGDPDADPVSFYLQIYIYNSTSKQWSPVYNDWVNGTSFTLTSFQPGSYYAWRVFAADTAQRSNPWYTASDWYYFSTVAAAQPQALNPWDTAQGQGCFEQWIAYAMSRLNSYNGSANFNACKPYLINKYGIWEGRGGQSFCFISASAPDSFSQYNNNKYWWIWDHYVPNPYWQVAEWNGAQIEGVRTYVTRCLAGG